MGKTQTRPWDAAEHLDSEEDMAAYLEAALEDKDPSVFLLALRQVVQARGMANVARKAHVGRESLYKTLSENGNPELRTINRLLHAMGLRLSVTAG